MGGWVTLFTVAICIFFIYYTSYRKFPTQTPQQEKEIKGIQIGKAEGELFLFKDNIILYVKNSKEFTKNLELIKSAKLQGIKSAKNLLYVYILAMNKMKRKFNQ